MFSRIASQTTRRAVRQVIQPSVQARYASTKPSAADNTVQIASVSAAIVGATGFAYAMASNSVHANMADEGLHAPKHPWYHSSPFHTYDHAAIRRGYQVYKEVCSACHSLERIAWRNLIDVSHTEDEVKALAEEVEYEDGPNEAGDMFQRPGKPSDYMPKPYPNNEAARSANAGALPPDLSLMAVARHGGADYVFALLTGYMDPPGGVEVREGLNYNPYFPGGAIAMARVLFDGVVEYEDGTPATTTQMARDVSTFLSWAAEPEHDERKKMGMKMTAVLTTLTLLSIWLKRFKWAPIKNRKIVYNPPK
ncbi:cytochrome C1 family-domain-containing protein [Spinellus fusiger]|nr:cytochrome C1 family-domain-containing protein [Spinellus fusiger]